MTTGHSDSKRAPTHIFQLEMFRINSHHRLAGKTSTIAQEEDVFPVLAFSNTSHRVGTFLSLLVGASMFLGGFECAGDSGDAQ